MRLFSQNVKVEALKRAPRFEGLSKKELAAYLNLSAETLSRLKQRGKI